MKPFVAAVVGPTGVGKTETALKVAKALDGEIVSMDSMQIYRRMDIGTAKPTEEQLSVVPHHMIDIAEPDEIYTTARYRDEASAVIRDIVSRGKLPLLVGGTGLYLDALSWQMTLGSEGADPEYRKALLEIAAMSGGPGRLHEMLRETDPERAAQLHPNDVRRVVRALEICRQTGETASSRTDTRKEGEFHIAVYGLSVNRETMYERINARVDEMMAQGLMDEVQALIASGIEPRAEGGSMQAIGYKEIAACLEGRWTVEEAVAQIKQASRRYAKRQWTWFRRDERTQWFDRDIYADQEALTEALIDRIGADLNTYRDE